MKKGSEHLRKMYENERLAVQADEDAGRLNETTKTYYQGVLDGLKMAADALETLEKQALDRVLADVRS